MINRILNRLSPEETRLPTLADCPACHGDVWRKNVGFRIDSDLTFVKCVCGHASAWYVNGHGPQLIYTGEPEETEDD